MESKNNKVNFLADEQSLNAVFSDIIEVEATDDNVKLNFGQRLPGKDGVENAKLVSRVALTWPHFLRFIQVSENVIADHTKKVSEIQGIKTTDKI